MINKYIVATALDTWFLVLKVIWICKRNMSLPDEIHSQLLAVYVETLMRVQNVSKLLPNGYPCC